MEGLPGAAAVLSLCPPPEIPPKMLFRANNPHYLSPLWPNQTESVILKAASCWLWGGVSFSLSVWEGEGESPEERTEKWMGGCGGGGKRRRGGEVALPPIRAFST